MAYTLYLYKEFPSKSNKTIRLEIFQKDYVGSAIEIEELAGNPIILNTDNSANDIDVPIIKTSLSINIIDTNQFDYSIFFTPDATKFKVIVKVSGTTEWTGFLTPDSFVQSESYRSSISLIARDNIGMLAEFEYDGTQLPVKINTTINNAFTKINFGGVLEYRVKKLDNAGVNILNDIVNGKLFVGRNYYEVVEILLRGIGCQLRYVGGNKYAIFDIADLKGYGDTLTAQTFLFIEQSGAVEIVPARKSIKITQDYGLQESIYDGAIPTEDFSFIEQRNAGLQYLTYRLPRPPIPAEQQDFYVNYYNIPIGARWVSTMALLEPTYFQRPESSILITGTNTESIVGLGKLMYSRAIPETNRDTNLKITVDVSKLIYGVGKYQRIGDELALWDMRIGTSNSKLHFRCNFFFDDGTTIQYLSSGGWREKPLDYADRFDIVLEQVEDESSTDTPYQTLEFNLGNADSAGTLTMEIYPYWLENNTLSLNVSAYVMELRDFDIKFVRLDEKIGGVESVGVINNDYNLAAEVNLSIGQVPNYLGNNLTMLAGIFQDASYYPPAFDFHRPSGTNYKLFELIGREIAHHYKTQKNKLSGTIINSTNFAAMPSFGKTFTDGVKNYALNYGALDFRNETMEVELIEVEDYVTEDYTFVEAEVESGSGSMGSGENEYIQWSNAGNVKRIYELATASEGERAGAYVMVDKSGLTEAKKVDVFALLDQKEDLLPATPSDPESKFLNGNREWSLINLGSGGNSPKVYFTSLASDVSGYKVLSYEPEATTSYCTTVLTNEEELCNVFLYPLGVGVELLDAGTWEFDFYAKVSSTAGNVTMRVEVFKRTTGGVESTLFSKSSEVINNTDYEYVKFIYTSPSIPVDSTDRIGVRIYGKNTIAAAITLTWALGDGDASYFVTPLAMRHSQLRGKNDEAGFQHITQGDQTFEGIKTFSGAFTDMVENRNTNLRIPKVAPTSATADEFYLYSLDSGFSGELPSGAGSVTSVALTMPTGFSVSGSPITESGTFGVTFASGYFLPTTTQFASKADVSLIGAANGIAPLDSGGKVALQYLPSTLLKYMGVWDASTNTPTLLATDTTRKGQVWNVSVAGTQFGIAFKLGDWLIYNDSGVAEKSDNSDDVVSVNGYTGAVILKTSDIAEQTNLYYTDARVKAYSDTLYSPLSHNHTVINGIKIGEIEGTSYRIIEATGFNLRIKSGDGLHNLSLLYGGGVTYDGYSIYHSGNSNSTSINWSAAKLTSTTLLLPQVAPTLSSGEMAIYGLESGFSGELPSGAGSVTSISMVVPTGLSVTPTTITESGTFTISYASGYQMMTSTESSKLAGIEANANNYTLPTATNLVLGGVKIGTNITITDGVISVHNPVTLGTANGLSLSTQVLSLGLASTSTNGALSSTDWNTFNGKQAKLIGTGASSLVRVNTLGVVTYDDNTYLTSNQTITLSGIITGSGTTAITTAIADGALSIAKTNGLQSALDAKMATASYPDLVAIEALAGTSGFLKKTAADTWTLDTNTYLTAITKAQVEAVLTGTITSHNHEGVYITNQAASSQSASFWISGSGRVGSLSANPFIIERATADSNIGLQFKNANNAFFVGLSGGGVFAIGLEANLGINKLNLDINGNLQIAGKMTLVENINTNLRIPKVAPTNPTSGEHYFFIVE